MLTSDLFLLIFVWIDDLLKQHPEVLGRPGPDPDISDAEMTTLMLMQALSGEISDSSWLRQVRRGFWDCFPRVPDRSRYQRRRRVLERGLRFLVRGIQASLGEDPGLRIADSAPIPICRNVRGNRCKIFQGQASWGWCDAQKTWFYGFRLHLLVTEHGLPAAWTILSANRHDRKGLDPLLDGQSHLDVYGDSAYNVRKRDREAFAERDLTITAAPRRDMKPLPRRQAAILKRVRFRIDWTLGLLSRIFSVQRTLARSVQGLHARTSFSLAAFNVGVFVNALLDRPLFAIKSLAA